MPCYHPITLYRSTQGPNPETGKVPLVSFRHGRGSVRVPCGRCIGCRLERSRQWAIRCSHEMQMHERNIFVTFTYRDDQLTYGGASHAILIPRHLTLFWKRLRKQYGSDIRYFACGEYGDKSNRPHYHAIIFGHDFEDKVYHSTKNHNVLYTSHNLDYLWSHGTCLIGDATFESAAYVARYVLKKRLGDTAETYEQEGITPEFVRMSRRPGIGSNWLDKYESDVYPNDFVITRNGLKIKPPKYYNSKYELTHPLIMEDIKLLRQAKADENWQESEPERLRIKERVKLAQTNTLHRSLD